MRIEIIGNLPGWAGLTKAQLRRIAAGFAHASRSRLERACGNAAVWHEVAIHLIHDRTSAQMHRAIMDIDGATDVITQAYDAIPPEEPGLYGELFVNLDEALRSAPARRTWSPAKELLLYIAHGMDHLSGADDHTEEDYLRMRRRELAWLRKALAT